MAGCPGRDRSGWTYDDIFEVKCPVCGTFVEFFKDDVRRQCSGCSRSILNPRQGGRCVDWCLSAERCTLADT